MSLFISPQHGPNPGQMSHILFGPKLLMWTDVVVQSVKPLHGPLALHSVALD